MSSQQAKINILEIVKYGYKQYESFVQSSENKTSVGPHAKPATKSSLNAVEQHLDSWGRLMIVAGACKHATNINSWKRW